MTLQEAYITAMEMPIKNLPKIIIKCSLDRSLYLKEDESYDSVLLTNDAADPSDTFYLTTEELMSKNWEVIVASEN